MHFDDYTCIRAVWLSRFRGMYSIVLVILILMLVSSLPTWPHSAKWGYGPSSSLGTILLILLILYFFGVIPR